MKSQTEQNNQELQKQLIIALFKEYLLLNKFDMSITSFKAECEDKNITCTVTKRTQMLEMLNLTDAMKDQLAKKMRGEPYIQTTLELLIQQFLSSNEKIQALQSQNTNKPNQTVPFSTQNGEISRPSSSKRKKTRSRNDVEEPLPQQPQTTPAQNNDFENIWNMPKQTLATAKTKIAPIGSNWPPGAQRLDCYIETCGGRQELLQVLFKDKRVREVSDNWYQSLKAAKQGSDFNSQLSETFQIKQLLGGPCGFVAVTQARALKYMFFGAQQKVQLSESFSCMNGGKYVSSSKIYENSILSGLYDGFITILEENKKSSKHSKNKCVLVLPETFNEAELVADRIISEMNKFIVVELTPEELIVILSGPAFVRFCFGQDLSSCIACLVLSYIFTRGLQNINSIDYDSGDDKATLGVGGSGSIFSNHNNCSQELVGLLLTGRAVGNVHDGELDLQGFKLQGVSSRADVGLVTIFEKYGYLEVGKNLRVPQFPAWVCFNEAHFTVLYTLQGQTILKLIQDVKYNLKEVSGTVKFRYYDGLDDQKQIYEITVTYDSARYNPKHEYESYVENLISTLLPAVDFSWNTQQKLL